jgi:hypothetical protein
VALFHVLPDGETTSRRLRAAVGLRFTFFLTVKQFRAVDGEHLGSLRFTFFLTVKQHPGPLPDSQAWSR